MKRRALVLFDIDGTLIRRAGPEHREALAWGLRRVTGLECSTDGIPLYGMLDPVILAAMLRRAGAGREAIRACLPAAARAAERRYAKTCRPIRDKLCPAVVETLEALRRRGALLGLVTGNLSRIGWRKLRCAGLRGYFRFGAFGEMGPTRTALVKLAVREARRRGWIRRGAPVTLIGDAPADIIAAKRNGVRAIAVRTGIATRAELAAEGPDFLLRDLRSLRPRMLE